MTVDDAAHSLLAAGSSAAAGTRRLLADLGAGAQRLLLDGTVAPGDVATATALVGLRDAVATLLLAASDPVPVSGDLRKGVEAAAPAPEPHDIGRRLRDLLEGSGTIRADAEPWGDLDDSRLAELGRLAVLTLPDPRDAELARDLAAIGVPPGPPAGVGEPAFRTALLGALPAEVAELAAVADEILGLLARWTCAFSAHSMLTSQVRPLTPVSPAVGDYRRKVARRLGREPTGRNVLVVDEAIRSAIPWPPPHPTSWWARRLEWTSTIVRQYAADTGKPWSVSDTPIAHDRPVGEATVLEFLLDEPGRDLWWQLSVGTPDERARYLWLQGR